MEDATAGPNNKTKNNSILLFRMGRMVCFGLLRAAGPTPKANKFFHFSLRKRNWKEFYLIEGWRRSRSVDEWMICFLLAGLIGGLWALQRQWLRQRERTARERKQLMNESTKRERVNCFSSFLSGSLFMEWNEMNEESGKEEKTMNGAPSGSAVSEWMESIDGGRKERRQINWRNEWGLLLLHQLLVMSRRLLSRGEQLIPLN